MCEQVALEMEGTLLGRDPDARAEQESGVPGAPDNELIFEGRASQQTAGRDADRDADSRVDCSGVRHS